MNYLTTLQAAASVGLSQDRIRVLCVNGLIPGAVKVAKTWLVPKDFKITRNGTRGPRPAPGPKSSITGNRTGTCLNEI